jgi:hypothetical protein
VLRPPTACLSGFGASELRSVSLRLDPNWTLSSFLGCWPCSRSSTRSATRRGPRIESASQSPAHPPRDEGRLGAAARSDLGLRAGQHRGDAADPASHRLLEPGRSLDDATQLAIGLYVPYSVAATVMSIPVRRLADSSTPVRVLAIGVAAFAIAYAGFAFVGASIPYSRSSSSSLGSGSARSRRQSTPPSRPSPPTTCGGRASGRSQRSRASAT